MTSPARFDLSRLVGFGLLAALVLLSVVPNAATRVFTWPWIFYSDLLLLAPVCLLGWRQFRAPPRRPPGGLAFIAAALSLGLSVLLSRRPSFSFEATLPLWSGLAWTWFLAGWLDDGANEPGRFMFLARSAGLAMLCPLLSGLGLWISDLAAAAGPVGWREVLTHLSSYRNPHPLGHSNYTGGFALLAVPWLGALAWLDRSRWRALWWMAGGIGLIVLLSASSRGAVLGALAMLAFALCGACAAGKFQRRHLLPAVALGLLLGAGLFASNPRLRAIVMDPSSLFRPNEGDVQRIGMLQGGWLLGWQRPWIGHGPGMTPFVYPEVRAQLVGGVETSYQLHNGWLQLWVSAGAVGLAAAGLLAFILVCAYRRWWRAPASERRSFGLVSAGTIGGYAVLALTDYQVDVLPIMAALGFHAGIVLAAPSPAPAAERRRWLGGLGLLLGGVVALVILAPEWRARQLFWEAWTATDRSEVIARLRAAVAAAPRNPHYRNHLGFQLAREAEATGNAGERRLAREELDRSLQLDPAQEPVHAALGWLWLSDDPRQSQRHFEEALRLLPDRDTLHLGLALTCLSLDDRPRAVRALAVECLVNPIFLASPLWPQNPLAPLHAEVVASLPDCLAEALRQPAMPEWRRPALRYMRAFIQWWLQGRAPEPNELTGAGNAPRLFFSLLARSAQGPIFPEAWPAPWNRLALAARTPAQAEEILRTPPAAPDAVIAGTLGRLRQPAADLGALLRQAAPGDTQVIRFFVDRSHFMFMHRNLDGPGYADLAPRFADEFVTYFAGVLFPPSGLLPGPVILQLDRRTPVRAAPAQ